MFKTTQNTFNNGLNKDVDSRSQLPTTYRDAKNITVMGNGDFFSASNISGSKDLSELVPNSSLLNVNVLGAFDCIGTYFSYGDDVQKNPSIVVFITYTDNGTTFDCIKLYDIKNNVVHDLLVTSVQDESTIYEALSFPENGTIDAVVFGENNVDRIYFEDCKNPLRDFDITDNAIANARVLTTQPLAPVDQISYVTQINGSGQNESGTYNFAYRYFNTETKKYTTWSLLTNGISVYPLDFSDVETLDEIYGGVPNEVTRKSIVLSIQKTDQYSLNFDSIQLAVIKNTDGLSQPSSIAFITSPNKDWFESPQSIVYDGSGLETTIDSQEIVTEDAAVRSAKTLVAKDNVLFRGNVKYHDRLVEEITYSGANTISQKLGASGASYNITRSNENNPQFETPGGFTNGPSRTDGAGNEIETKLFRTFNSFLDLREGSGAFGADIVNGVIVGSFVSGDVPDNQVNLKIPEDIRPGNEIFLRVASDPQGMKEWPSLNPNNGEWGFAADYYFTSLTGFALDIPAFFSFVIGLGNNSNTYDVHLGSYRYIVQTGDTPQSIVSTIIDQISPSLPSDRVRVENGGDELRFRVADTLDSRRGPNNDFRVAVDVEFGMLPGIDLSIATDGSEIQDLINNNDSTFGGYKNPNNISRYKGYFRDEVYRFGLTYMDKYGNWSRPVPFDFSDYNARITTGDEYEILILEPQNFPGESVSNGITRVKINQSNHGIELGDLILLNLSLTDIVYAEVRGLDTNDNQVIYIEGEYSSSSGFIQTLEKCIGGEYSFDSEGFDWKFPNRGNGKFPMMSIQDDQGEYDEQNTFIQPIGLNIQGITDHPEWAVSLAIVRVRRQKNILWQSPHITGQAVMPSLLQDGYNPCGSPVAGSSPLGTYGPKSFAKGVAKSWERDTPVVSSDIRSSYRYRQRVDNQNIPKLSIVAPPEYMYQNDGVNFGSALFPSGARLEFVDVVTAFRTPEFDVDGSGADDGDNPGDQIAFGIRADNAMNYYYKDVSGFFSLKTFPFSSDRNEFSQEQIPDGASSLTLFYAETVNLGSGVSLPAPPADLSFRLKNISSYGELELASTYNCSNEVTLQKQVCILTKDKIGDIGYFCCDPDNTFEEGGNIVGTSDFLFLGEEIRSGFAPFFSNKWNIGASGMENRGGDRSTLSQRVTDLVDGASSAFPIVNLTRQLSDDRYGTMDEVHEFIFTGSYAKIQNTNDVIDIDVWGGDCFICKHSVKVADTHLDVNGEFIDDGDSRLFAYGDFQEILMCYVESTVNCDLQASQFTYPVLQRRSLSVFSPDYEYPYNPGYSVENELKIWVNVSNTEENRLEYPARIVYSDQKIFQTDVEGFDRYRAFSFYDMPEEYSGITKLIKLANDNVYVIQESAVAVIPINKSVIEDSTGGQMVINSNTLINPPTFIMNENGSQHIRSVRNSDTNIFFMDAAKREVFKIGGGQSDGKISDNGMYSEFLNRLESLCGIPDHKVVSGYDFNNNEYWIGINSYDDKDFNDQAIVRDRFLYVWSDKIGAWMTELVFASDVEPLYMRFSHSLPYLLGVNQSQSVVIESLYNGDVYGRLLGSIESSSLTFVVNEDEPQGKTFDVLRIDSNERLSSANAVVYKESNQNPQETTLNLNVKPRHDSYTVPMLLDSRRSRLRGKYCEITLFMNNGNQIKIDVMNVITKYRLSARIY